MAKKVEIELDIKGNIVESTKNLKALKNELKGVAAGTAEWSRIKNDIRDVEDALESAGQSSEDFKGLLENAPGPLGMLGGAIKKVELATKSFGAAWKAIGIGALVAIIGMLVAAFSQTEGSMKKLEPLMIMLEKLFAGLVEAFQPLLEAFVEIAMKVLPVFISGVKNFYGGLMALFTLVKEAGTGVGKILKGIFTLDTDALEEGYNQLKGSWDKTKESFNQFTDNFEKGYAKQSKTQKENADKAKELADKAAEEAKKRFEEKLKRMESEDKLDEATLKKLKAEALSLVATEQEKLDVETRFAELSQKQRLKDLDDKMVLYKKDSLEYKALQTEKINAESEYITQLTSFKEQQKKITDDANKVALENAKKKAEDERQIALIGLQNDINDLDAKNKLADLDFAEDLKRLEEKRIKVNESEKLELAAAEGNEVEKNKVRQKYADLRKGIILEEIATERAATQAKADIQIAYIGLVGQFGSLLQQIAGKNKALAITGLIIEKAAAIGLIIASTAAANAKAVLASPVTFGQPWVAINTISAALSIASTIAASVKAINEINNANTSSAGSAGTTPAQSPPRPRGYANGGLIGGARHAQGGTLIEAEQGEAIMSRGSVTLFAPLLSALNQAGGGTPFGSTMIRSNDNPKSAFPSDYTQQPVQIVKTYVVESELTSEQQKQARLRDLSTI